MRRFGPSSLIEGIVKHPWRSLRDGVVLSAFMTLAVLIARRYDIFTFMASLAAPELTISPGEAMLLAGLFAFCIYIFIARRIQDERCDEAYRHHLEAEMRELRELAMQDPLTRLPNRRALLPALEIASGTCRDKRQRHAFFLLDLNGFKHVNDLYGHGAGDRVLQVVAERFRRAARPSDLLARLGGDEFAVLSFDVDRHAAEAIGNRIAASLDTAITCEGHTHELGVAIGGVVIPDDGETCEAILRNADLAMYRAKERAGCAVAFFDARVDAPEDVRKIAG